jgi:hypothetical protein
MPAASFARCIGVRASTIYRWQREARARTRPAAGVSAFTAVKVVDDAPKMQPDLVIEIGQNVRVRVQPGFDSESIVRLLRLAQQC